MFRAGDFDAKVLQKYDVSQKQIFKRHLGEMPGLQVRDWRDLVNVPFGSLVATHALMAEPCLSQATRVHDGACE